MPGDRAADSGLWCGSHLTSLGLARFDGMVNDRLQGAPAGISCLDCVSHPTPMGGQPDTILP